MLEQPPLDLFKPDAWFGLRPGMTRAQVLAGLKQLGAETEETGAENWSVVVSDHDLEFWFATDGSERLRQLAVDGDEILWAGQALMGARVDDALRALEPLGSAVWEANDAIGEPFPKPDDAPPGPVSDEELLEEGTIWLPERGLGLVIGDGEVTGVAWRAAQDLPAQFAGPVTEAQRQLSRRTDLETHLRQKDLARATAALPKDPLAPLRTVLTLLAIAALALILREGVRETQRWSRAVTLPARLVSIERGPMKQFRDYLPPAIGRFWPAQRPVQVDLYRLEYVTDADQRQEAVFESADFYIAPREPGDETQVAYLAGDPPRVKGLPRARDAAFLEYVPWGIALGVLYLLGQIIITFLPTLWRLLRQAVPKSTTMVDPDRPELR